MLQKHPTIEDFEKFLKKAARSGNSTRNTLILRHLLSNCSICRDRLQLMGWSLSRLDRLVHLSGGAAEEREDIPQTQSGYRYDTAFAKAEEAVSRFLAPDPLPAEPADALLAELDRYPFEEQVRLVEEEARFASPQLVQLLIERSHGERYTDPEKLSHWAGLARSVATRCAPEALGNALKLADLRARAWGHFGNALRVAGHLRDAEEAMITAQGYLKAGTGDPAVRARLYEQIASLYTFQRRFEAAIEILDEAAEIYRELGENHSLARTLVKEAISSLYAGEAENAVRILNQAIPLIDHEEDPHLLLAACHNLVLCYIDLDRPEQALSLYFETQELYKEFSDSLILLRARWQEGQLLRDLGHLRAAEAALVRARTGFLEQNLMYEVAVVSLDLAAVYVKLKALDDVRKTVTSTIPIFQALRIGRDGLAALLQLQQVADQEQQALALIRSLNAQLEPLAKRNLGK